MYRSRCRPCLPCYNWKTIGHVASVCRRNTYVVVEESDEECRCNCDGNHVPKLPECSVWMKKVAVARIRAIQQVFYVETVRIAEGVSREEMVVDVPQSAVNDKYPDVRIVKKVAFVVQVINSTSQTNQKNKRS